MMKLVSYSRLALYEQCPRQFYYKYVLGHKTPDTKPLALGKAVHKALEVLANNPNVPVEEAIKQGLIECGFHSEVEPNEVRRLVENALFKKVEGVPEYHFQLPLFDDLDTPEIQGYIDRWNNDVIWDYKTNWQPYDILSNYQLALYAWAVSQITGLKKIKGHLFFLRYKKIYSYVFTEKEMNLAKEWAKRLITEINFKLEILEIYPDKVDELFPYQPNRYCSSCPFILDCYKKA
ncbi:PD-(D/E)XK nuclease family protein [Caldifermentibacillus hisashii]|uniref:PD-(D/E)XK nuclease family protein n=1 Tax=Caldifermentibacillus hisashii TaxID=996558 RepID=UPI002E223D2A|nr:PD-(D/E)XK nuclease family protein [Caldifermentibacillus hisashii]